jgi:hypothetical protein
LATTRSSGSKLLGKDTSIVAELPCLGQKKQNYPECVNSGCSRTRSSCERAPQVGYEPDGRIKLVGSKCGHRHGSTVFVAKNETTLSSTTQDVVERIDFVGKNATTVMCDHLRSQRKSICRRFEWSRGVRRNTKSIRYKRGRTLRIIHDKESIYVNTARGHSLRMFMKEITTRILWHTASKLSEKRRPPRRLEIQLSPDIFSWVELAQVLDVPRVSDILAIGVF